MPKILVIDNFDSFTFNLVDDLQQLGAEVFVVRNNQSMSDINQFVIEQLISHILISPGPGTPEVAGNCLNIIHAYYGKIPILGICLGMQAMVVAFGGTVDRCPVMCHGKNSLIEHQQSGVFKGLKTPMLAGRYHSLSAHVVPENLKVTASFDDIVMAVENLENKLFGVQFHPESILSPDGKKLLKNFLTMNLNIYT